MTRPILPMLVICMVMVWSSDIVTAAPVKPAAAAADAAPISEPLTTQSTTDWAEGAVPGTGRTMELLLEMQKKDPGPPADPSRVAPSRPAAAKAPASPGRSWPAAGVELGVSQGLPAAPTAPSTAAPVLFGATQAPAIRATAAPSTDWRAAGSSGGTPAQRPHRPSGEVHPWARLPGEFITWLRLNRYTVVAVAVVTVVLVWVGGAVIGRRRYT